MLVAKGCSGLAASCIAYQMRQESSLWSRAGIERLPRDVPPSKIQRPLWGKQRFIDATRTDNRLGTTDRHGLCVVSSLVSCGTSQHHLVSSRVPAHAFPWSLFLRSMRARVSSLNPDPPPEFTGGTYQTYYRPDS
jgi:hypothetical protein